MRITIDDLEKRVKFLNRFTDNPTERFTKINGEYFSNAGHYLISQQYGGYELQQICNDGGGVDDVLGTGHIPKKELYYLINAYIEGIRRASKGLA